jgi:uncharacterized protein YcbK (DUF882 family)
VNSLANCLVKRRWLVLSLFLLPAGVALAAPPRPPSQSGAPRGYARNVQTWHTPPAARTIARDDAGRATLSLFALNTNERVEVLPVASEGGFSDVALERVAHFMREPSTGLEHPIHPRLLDLVYRIESHFAAAEIRMLSGYRSPRGGRASNHGRGRAMDLIVPGHPDEEVARFVREQGFTGVGVYPVSGFIHVDVRDRSYFWVDSSGPGKRNRERGIMHDVAQRSDAHAIARGEKPVEPYSVDFDFEHASAPLSSVPIAEGVDAGMPHADPDLDDTTESDGT